MKKSKLYIPLLTIASLGTMAAAITTSVSCGNKTNIELDSSTAKEQETNQNITSATYAFDVKNYNESEDEIETEVTDTDTKDQVNIEISKTYYDSETKKFYVIVTISKEDGSLNDQEEISFSLNFKCHQKGQSVEKWAKKIEKFSIKHKINTFAHFDDTDVSKITYTKEKGKKQVSYILPTAITDTWTQSQASNGEYNVSKLHVYVNKGMISRLMPITLAETAEVQLKGEVGSQMLIVTVDYDTTDANEGNFATFNLLFTYDVEELGKTREEVLQVIGGFCIKFGEEPQVPHTEMFGSRERHVYQTTQSETVSSSNFISFILDNENAYKASDFQIKTNNENVSFDSFEILPIKTEEIDANILVANYTLKNGRREHIYGETNVEIVLNYTNPDDTTKSWTEKFRGLSFLNIKLEEFNKPLISCDATKLPTADVNPSSENIINDAFTTISPFDIQDIIYSSSTFVDADSNTYEIPFEFTQINYETSTAKLDTNNVAGLNGKSGQITYKVLVKTMTTSYYYQIVSDIKFAA